MGKRDLNEWMQEHRFTPSILARELNLKSSATIFEWRKNNRVPYKETLLIFNELIKRIEKKPFEATEFFDSDRAKKRVQSRQP